MTLYEVDEAANRIREEVEVDANIIFGSTCDDRLEGFMRVSIVATGIKTNAAIAQNSTTANSLKIDNSVYDKSFSQKKFSAISGISSLKDEQPEAKVNASINYNNLSKQEERINMDNNNLNHESSIVNDNLAIQEEVTMTDNNDLNHESSIVNDNLAMQEEGTKMDTDNFKNTELNRDENVINNTIENNENIKEDNVFQEDVSHNNINNNEGIYASSKIVENSEEKTSSSRLSLFDNIDESKVNNELQNVKKEPVLGFVDEHGDNEDQSGDEEYNQDFDDKDLENNKDENEDLESKEDELLDIPTFLRRQAN